MSYVEADPFFYCEFYNHCLQRPCKSSRTNFQKDHDSDLNRSRMSGCRYIIQFRHPLDSIISFYRLVEGKMVLESWLEFLTGQLSKWERFVEKWVAGAFKQDLLVSYDSLVNDPEQVLMQVLKFQNPHQDPDEETVRQVMHRAEIRDSRARESFLFAKHEETEARVTGVQGIVDALGL